MKWDLIHAQRQSQVNASFRRNNENQQRQCTSTLTTGSLDDETYDVVDNIISSFQVFVDLLRNKPLLVVGHDQDERSEEG